MESRASYCATSQPHDTAQTHLRKESDVTNAKLMAALAVALTAPAIGGAVVVEPRRERYGFSDWFKANGKLTPKGKRFTRDPSKLQLRGYAEPPCDAPDGYHWNRATAGNRLYYLVKSPPGEREAVYDEANDRTIIRSGWGYVKPTYAHGDVR